jgi:hypothetical protein
MPNSHIAIPLQIPALCSICVTIKLSHRSKRERRTLATTARAVVGRAQYLAGRRFVTFALGHILYRLQPSCTAQPQNSIVVVTIQHERGKS